jgi:hypothetical protein
LTTSADRFFVLIVPKTPWRVACLFLLVSAAVHTASAQSSDVPSASGRRLVYGPLSFQPRISLTNLGVDTNVFNDSANPTRDFTISLLPAVDSRLRVGRGTLTSVTGLELVYFRKAKTQRSTGFNEELRFDLPLARVTPFVGGERMDSHKRPTPEIDARIRETTKALRAGVGVRLGSRVRVEAAQSQRDIRYDDVGAFAQIAESLDRRSTQTDVSMNMDLTPLTTFVVRAGMLRDRFLGSSLRDADSRRLGAGFLFKPFALISGSAFLGVRHLSPLNPAVPKYTGLEADGALAYLWRDRTRLAVTFSRALEYSIESEQPYFIVTGGSGSITQALATRWDVVLSASQNTLTYQSLVGTDAQRRDRVRSYSTGLGYHVTPEARIGFDIVYTRRLSALEGRQYDGFRFGGSFVYAY